MVIGLISHTRISFSSLVLYGNHGELRLFPDMRVFQGKVRPKKNIYIQVKFLLDAGQSVENNYFSNLPLNTSSKLQCA